MKRKKIAFVTPVYLPAHLYGSDTVVRLLAEKFATKGFDTSVITSDALTPRRWYDPLFSKRIAKPSDVIGGVTVFRLPCNQLFSSGCYFLRTFLRPLLPLPIRESLDVLYAGPALVGLRDLLQQRSFDVVHCSPFPLYLNKQVEDCIATLSKKPKLVLTPFFHANVEAYRNRALREILRRADIIHAVTHVEKADMQRIHGVESRKIAVLPLFIDIRSMHETGDLVEDVETFKDRYHIHGRKLLLYAGLKGPMKGAIDVLRAVDHLYKRDTTYSLVAIGQGGKEWAAAKRELKSRCLIDFGYKEGREKETIFAACDIFCMPSKSDSFGLVYLEAWHKKKPVIAADVPAMRELIGDNETGFLVPFGDTGALAAAIEQLMDDAVLSKKFGFNGYRALTENYTVERQYAAYRTLLTS